MRWHAEDLAGIEAFGQAEGLERTEAIRALVRLALKQRERKRR
jgi:hypothetical protein